MPNIKSLMTSERLQPLGPPLRPPEPVKPDPEGAFEKGNQRFPDGRVQGNNKPKALPNHQSAWDAHMATQWKCDQSKPSEMVLWADGVHDDTDALRAWMMDHAVFHPNGVAVNPKLLMGLRFLVQQDRWISGFDWEKVKPKTITMCFFQSIKEASL